MTGYEKRDAHPKIVIIDESALIYDPQAPLRYRESEIHIARQVIERLASIGGEQTEFARNAREALNWLVDNIPTRHEASAKELGFILLDVDAEDSLSLAGRLQQQNTDRSVVLVTRDAGTRLLAQSKGIAAESHQPFGDNGSIDYNTGVHRLPGVSEIKLEDPTTSTLLSSVEFAPNELIIPATGLDDAVVTQSASGESLKLHRPQTAIGEANAWGIRGRTDEQSFALWLLNNSDIDLVSIEGNAGTGKTLLALASGLQQTLEDRRYIEVIVTRATIAIGEDIGFLPGTEEEKMTPWMGAIEDNLEVLLPQSSSTGGSRNWGKAAGRDIIGTRVRVKSINFMRGRTFSERFIIIDEAQNLTPFQMKTLLTRAGQGTKIVLLGNLAQIDTAWLDPGTSGFSWVISRMRAWHASAHITLSGVERSALARQAVEVL